ncbi:MAG: S8 family peptidase [Coriobacteriia bacterium]|nr:S8 family peptidase [Coriobacteriia bacterium]
MTRKGIRSAVLALALAAVVLAAAVPVSAAPSAGGSRKIVVFRSGEVEGGALQRIERLGGVRLKSLPMIGAAAVWLPDAAAGRAVGRLAEVERVEDDIVLHALAKPEVKPSKPGKPQPAQTLPWGVDRIEADLAWATSTADPVKLAVVDTGIDPSHPDLVDNLKGGVSTVAYTSKYRDDNGHGSHVAGIAGAVDNGVGVVGVGHAVDLYAVKVLDRNGSGYLSDVIEGLQWSAANGMQVANMSLGTSTYSASFASAVKAAHDAGVVLVAAAGNSGPGADTVSYPARFPEVIAVSATTSSDALASYSSTGPSVELAAPGSSIYSTYKGSTYKTLSGTSMASPHVAGTVALLLDTPVAGHDANGNGRWDLAEVRAKLRAAAEDLGPAGWDAGFGYGLVRADRAVAP